jgi:hypothetical protein
MGHPWCFSLAALWPQQEGPSSNAPGYVLLLLVFAAAIWGLVAWSRREAALERYLEQQGFKYLGEKLPSTLKPPSITWMPEYRLRNCYTGQRNDVQIALFQTVIPQGEGNYTRTMVAVRREPFNFQLGGLLGDAVVVDSTSTPEWIIASYKGGGRTPEGLEAMLSALTVRTPEPSIL